VEVEDEAHAPPAVPVAKRPWPTGLTEQIKAMAELLPASPLPLALAGLEARLTARGCWHERPSVMLDTRAAPGRAWRVTGDTARWSAA
jgi:hypothetical protein